MGKRLKDNQYEIITIEGITFEDGKTYKNENEINNALSKNLKPKMIFTFCQKTKDSEKIKISFPMSYIDFIVKKSDKEIESKLNEEQEKSQNNLEVKVEEITLAEDEINSIKSKK